jgi:hypothetical protein
MTMDPVRLTGEIRDWRPERAAGLAVADIPAELVATLGGLKQQRIHARSTPWLSSPARCPRAAVGSPSV